jgi:hypothetical protein
MSVTVHEAQFSRDASNVSYAAKLHQVEIRTPKNCIFCTRMENATDKKESPARAGLVNTRCDQVASIASRDKLN